LVIAVSLAALQQQENELFNTRIIFVNEQLKVSAEGVDLLKGEEGFVAKLGKDGKKPVIGYGCDLNPTEAAFYAGKTITEADATALLFKRAEPVETFIYLYVKVPLNQNQFDALVSLIYNIGVGNFFRSSIRTLLNQADYKGAADRFALYDKVQNAEGVLEVSEDLVKRRAKEAALFMRIN
jgi:lysozyme